ncbi:MAG: CDP-alcohol phosphatidyltransferase [Dehalococcoidia bacterium]|nr:CDP-alcohol phosphatidyltransferase [Dehalococcoidia bacterium]
MGGTDSYSAVERRLIAPFRRFMASLLSPLVWLLARLGVHPNLISGLQIPGGVAVILLADSHPRVAFLIFVSTLLLDGIDGALARATGRSSTFGALFDQFADHFRETLVIAALAVDGGLSVLLAVLYPFVYTSLNLTLYLANQHGAPLPLAIKSYMVVYPAIFLYLWWGVNILNVAVALSLFLMGAVITMGLWNLSRAMNEGGRAHHA